MNDLERQVERAVERSVGNVITCFAVGFLLAYVFGNFGFLGVGVVFALFFLVVVIIGFL